MNSTDKPNTKRSGIDCHVHIVGNGSSGSGCTLRLRGYQHFLSRVMLREMGLPFSTLKGDLDHAYASRLAEIVEESSLEKIVILAHEHVRDAHGTVIQGFGSLYVPNDYVLSLCRKYPRFLAGVSIHPARRDAMEELERCISGGAVLMKCLPNCQNIDLSDKRFIPFYERMAEAGLPLLAHTGGELAVRVYEHRFADPRFLELPLQVGVTVIAAHCGTSAHYFDPDYTERFSEMLGRFPNLYGDNSGLMTPFRSLHLPKLLREPIKSRVIYGSDLPVPISGTWAYLRRLIGTAAWEETRTAENVLERDRLIKQAMGFPPESFTRLAGLLRNTTPRHAASAL